MIACENVQFVREIVDFTSEKANFVKAKKEQQKLLSATF